MAKVKYVNKATGKVHTGEAEEVKILQSNPRLKDVFSYETEIATPAEPVKAKNLTQGN